MNTTEKAAALKALCDFQIEYSEVTRRWWVNAPIEVSDGAILSSAGGHGETPEAALHLFWEWVTEIGMDKHLRVRRRGEVWRGRWNGYMWSQETHDGR